MVNAHWHVAYLCLAQMAQGLCYFAAGKILSQPVFFWRTKVQLYRYTGMADPVVCQWAQGGCCCAVFITTSVLALFGLAAFESIIRPGLKLKRSRQKHQSLLLAGILTFCILSCAGPAMHGSFGVAPVGVSELMSSQVQLYHPAFSPISPSAMMQSTSPTTAETASSSFIVYRPPALNMASISTDSVKRATFPAAISVSATTMAVWQPHPDTAIDFDAPKTFVTAYISASTGPGAQHLPVSNRASCAMVLVFLETVHVVSDSTLLMARHHAANLLSFHIYLYINTCADPTVPLHCNGLRSSILVVVVFATHSTQTTALTTPAPMLPTTFNAPNPF